MKELDKIYKRMIFKMLDTDKDSSSLWEGKIQGESYNWSQFTALREFPNNDVVKGTQAVNLATWVEKTELRSGESKVARICRTVQEKKNLHTHRTREIYIGSLKYSLLMQMRKLHEAWERTTPQN